MLAFAGVMALLQRGQDADRHVHAGAGIADRREVEHRRAIGGACHAHRTAHGLCDRFEAFEAGIGAVGAEAFDGGIDQTRIDSGE